MRNEINEDQIVQNDKVDLKGVKFHNEYHGLDNYDHIFRNVNFDSLAAKGD